MTGHAIFVPELLKAGTSIQGVSADAAFRFERYVSLMQAQLYNAAAALMMFEMTPATAWTSDPSSPAYARRREDLLMETLRTSPPSSARDFERLRFEAEVQAKRELWAEGQAPERWGRALHWMYAREFVYSLDTLAKALGELAKEPGSPSNVDAVLAKLRASVPGLKDARDSLHHLEDRALGRAKDGKPIVAQPLATGSIQTGGGLLMIENLDGSRFGITAGDGRFVEVDVCRATLEAARLAVQEAIDAFKWTGPPTHLP
jgi:hypothetical protein